jgi:hypothetical protein
MNYIMLLVSALAGITLSSAVSLPSEQSKAQCNASLIGG